MTFMKAAEQMMAAFPGRIPTGYWTRSDGAIILNTKRLDGRTDMAESAQYVVTSDGNVYGTNPMMDDLDLSKMKKI